MALQQLNLGRVKGDQGEPGSQWYTGTTITGTNEMATVFPSSGVLNARVNDFYLNDVTTNAYKCVVGGDPSIAQWEFVTTLQGVKGDAGVANIWIGTKVEAEQAIQDGEFENGQVVFITDDETGQVDENVTKYSKNFVYSGSVYRAIHDELVTSIEEATACLAPTTTPVAASAITELNQSIGEIAELIDHNNPRVISKDITSYYNDGSLWDRLEGRNGYKLFEDVYAGDYFQMSRPISAYERTNTYQEIGSEYVTIAGINTLMWNGDNANVVNYNHLVMVPGKGRGGKFHFGRSRMNSSNTTDGAYYNSEMHTTTIGAVVSAGSTASTATINQQLYAEFGAHLATTRELLSNSTTNSASAAGAGYTGTSNNWSWYDCQAVLMSEIEVYGANVFSSSAFDTGNACVQLPIFRDKRFLNNRSAYYWLKNVASSASFCGVYTYGLAGDHGAGNASYYVRPRFVLRA